MGAKRYREEDPALSEAPTKSKQRGGSSTAKIEARAVLHTDTAKCPAPQACTTTGPIAPKSHFEAATLSAEGPPQQHRQTAASGSQRPAPTDIASPTLLTHTITTPTAVPTLVGLLTASDQAVPATTQPGGDRSPGAANAHLGLLRPPAPVSDDNRTQSLSPTFMSLLPARSSEAGVCCADLARVSSVCVAQDIALHSPPAPDNSNGIALNKGVNESAQGCVRVGSEDGCTHGGERALPQGKSGSGEKAGPSGKEVSGNKIVFGDTCRYGDGRILLPVAFATQNFSHHSFPVSLTAELVVDGQVIMTACPVTLSRTMKQSRKVNNHWVSGYQRHVKHLRDPRLRSFEVTGPSQVRICLSSSGVWAAAAPLAATSVLTTTPAVQIMMDSILSTHSLGPTHITVPTHTHDNTVVYSPMQQGMQAVGTAAAVQQLDTAADAADCAAAVAAAAAAVLGAVEGPAELPAGCKAAGCTAMAAAAAAATPADAAATAAVPAAAATAAATTDAAQCPAAAAAAAIVRLVDPAAGCAAKQQPVAQPACQHAPAPQAHAGVLAQTGYAPICEGLGAGSARALDTVSTAALIAASLDPTSIALMLAGIGAQPGTQPAAATTQAGSQLHPVDAQPQPQPQAKGRAKRKRGLAATSDPAPAAAATPAPAAAATAAPAAATPAASTSMHVNTNLSKLYDGRIHVPLSIITQHFKHANFPLDISTTVYVNSRIIGSGLKARLVQYKKHKNPSQFNYWVTGLQKATNKYNDLRQAGVGYCEGGLVIHLIAAEE